MKQRQTTSTLQYPDPDVIGTSPAPSVANAYLHGPGVDEPLVWWTRWTDSSGNSNHFKPVLLLADGLGSITGLTANADYPDAPKPEQGLAASYRYDSFGNQAQHCNAPVAETAASQFKLARLNPYRYAAREWLDLDWNPATALGLSDNRARFYDPSLGSFLQEDPVWNSNLYSYVGNNPVGFIDPLGNFELHARYRGTEGWKYEVDFYTYNDLRSNAARDIITSGKSLLKGKLTIKDSLKSLNKISEYRKNNQQATQDEALLRKLNKTEGYFEDGAKYFSESELLEEFGSELSEELDMQGMMYEARVNARIWHKDIIGWLMWKFYRSTEAVPKETSDHD
jgi:RHS repeat-associated protein